jgi:hypothetical protein
MATKIKAYFSDSARARVLPAAALYYTFYLWQHGKVFERRTSVLTTLKR